MAPLIGTLRHHADPAHLRVVRPHRGRSACTCACCTGATPHHIVEAQFKAVRPGAARRRRASTRGRAVRIPSTKGDVCEPSDPGSSSSSTTARATCARPSGRWRGSARTSTVTADPRPRWTPTGWSCPASARSPPAWRVCARSAATGHRRAAGRRPAGARHLRRHAGAVRARASSTASRTEGCGEWPGVVERLHAPVLPHMGWNTVAAAGRLRLFAGLDGRAVLLRALLRRAPPLEPAAGVTAAAGDLGRARRAVRRRGRERAAVRDPVPPGEVRRRRARALLRQLAGDDL